MAHLHEVRDMDTHFIIDPLNNMAITNANEAKNTLQLGDHDSEVYTFELPRFIEGHDMTLCNLVEVHFINAGSDKVHNSNGVFVVEDMEIADDGNDTLLFTWTVSGDGTKYAGSLNFRIKFACIEDGKYTYKKWSATYKGIIVADGFDNGEYIETEYADVLAAWESRLVALEQNPSGVQTVNGVAPDEGGNVVVEVPAQVQPDLSVNDESDPAYVKGRTHYETESLTINGVYNDRTYSYSMDVPAFPGFKESDAVTVIWDGTEYEVTAVATSSGVYVGNWMFKSYMSPDTGHPFLWYYGENSDGTAFSTVYANDADTHTIQIKDEIFSVPLDKKFLPLDAIYKKDLKDSMKPLLVQVSLGSISSGTISNITFDKSFDVIKKAYDENREIRFYTVNNQSSYKEYETFTVDYIISNSYPYEFMGFYLRRISYEVGGNIYFYKIKNFKGSTYSGSRYALSKA